MIPFLGTVLGSPKRHAVYSRSRDWSLWAKALNAALGTDYTPEDLDFVGERVNTLERCYNLREGLTREDDTLPRRLLEEALPDGPAKGEKVGEEALQDLLSQYYAALGWDTRTGVPTKATLARLNLDRLGC
ncbi:MAG TPA: hypothetical protein GX735_03555 [Firmicutes bacterium]|nr:hypothetical protein [Bacillota bacterium]